MIKPVALHQRTIQPMHLEFHRENWARSLATLLWATIWLLSVPSVHAAQDDPTLIPHGQDRAPNRPFSPAEAIAAMTVPPGFQVELVASEPQIVNPVAMTFDERGRIWITESLEYPRRPAGPGRDRVKILEDTDGDGRADRSQIFAEGLNIPSGIAVGHGGVWVANSPDLLFLRDTDNDGKADTREVVATGFGRSDTHELPNSLTWGPDGWLYGWNGVFNPCKVASKNGKTYNFTCAIYRIHPRTRIFEVWCEGTSNPWGIAIDPEGSFFSSACVIDHLWHLVEDGYYIRQGGPYPPFTWPMPSIVDHQHQKAAYCGITYFDSPAYPPEYRNKLYMGNIHGNGINVDTLERNGSTYKGITSTDFLRANDSWFMPVSQKIGPDGCLYILDWYDQYHCYQDANRDPEGIDRLKGRLYRVRYNNTPRRSGFDLVRANDDDLIQRLGSSNAYDRETAQRILIERASPSIRQKLEKQVLDAKATRPSRLHALWSLIGTDSLDPALHSALLDHPDPTFRAWAIRAAGNQPSIDPSIREKLLKLAEDASPDVRLQVVIASTKIIGLDPLPIFDRALSAGPEDPIIPHLVWRKLEPLLPARQTDLLSLMNAPPKKDLGIASLSPLALEKLLASPRAEVEVITALFSAALRNHDGAQATRVVAARFRSHSLPAAFETSLKSKIKQILKPLVSDPDLADREPCVILLAYCGDPESIETTREIFAKPGNAVANEEMSDREELRLQALGALLQTDAFARLKPVISATIDGSRAGSSLEFREQILELLGDVHDPAVATMVLESFNNLPAPLKPRVVELLTRRPSWANQLISAVSNKRLDPSVLNVNQLRKLQRTKDPVLASKLKQIWGVVRDGRDPRRERKVAQYVKLIQGTPGDPEAGQTVFQKLCAQCHKIYGQGQDVGPELTSNGRNDFNQLVSNVFDPSLVIGPGYQATTIATTDGRVLTGLLAEEGQDRLVLKLQGGKQETIPRDQIDERKTADVSLMPEEIEKQITPQEIVDLFTFLCLDKPPTDPTARSLPGSGPIARRPK